MYNVAIIGCGRISHKIAEGVAKNHDRMRLVALCDPIEEKMFETEKTYNKKMDNEGSILKYKDYKEILKENKKIDLKILSEKIKEMCKPLLNELEDADNISTYGEKAYKEYHLTGARGLAISGYEIVLLDGINKLKDFCKTLDFETACILLLFYYMSVLDDTNIVNRANIATLKEVQILSKELFEENKKTLEKESIKNSMSKLNDIFIEKNISAGGSADLLILTIFIHLLTDEE